MLVIPAIDLKDGQCVRLRQGDMEDSTVFSDDPVATAERWAEATARRLHMVDLNGAFAGKPKNAEAAEISLPRAFQPQYPPAAQVPACHQAPQHHHLLTPRSLRF